MRGEYMRSAVRESLESQKLREWEKQTDFYKRLREEGVQAVFSSLPGIENAFCLAPERPFLVCGDEGTTAGVSSIEGNPRHLAGSGILMDEEKLLSLIREMKISVITSHDNCGAAQLAQKPAALWASDIAKKASIGHAHISSSDMRRPRDFHNARMIVYGAMNAFNWGAVDGLPPSFSVADRTLVSSQYAEEELQIYFGIAAGGHGFGQQFITKQDPIIVVVAGHESRPEFSANALKREAQSVRKTLSVPDMMEIHTFEPHFPL